MVDQELFAFVQLELAGSVGLDDARYLAREPDERVLVVRAASTPAAPRRRLRRRRPHAVAAGAKRPPPPASTLTVIRPVGLGSEADARAWLEAVRGDADATMAEIAAAVSLINRAITARRADALDPYLPDVSAEHATAVRIGYGPGERVADGRW
ncbi:MAG TPA: hypothetical protein VK919_05890, partial [Solirubrobacterales bacterium]|nr:hypothetical protein [Solirubrobacterales bacterium]